MSIGPTLFMFNNRFCDGGICSFGEYRAIARKRDEKLIWQAPEGKVILRAYETDAGDVLVLPGEPAKFGRAVDRVGIRFSRVNLATGALTKTKYRYVAESRLPGVRGQFIGITASETLRHPNGNPKTADRELIDASGRVLAKAPLRADNEVAFDITDTCYHATVLWQFGLTGDTEGEWRQVAYSGEPFRMPDAKADPASIKAWCDDAESRVWATRDREGKWTARLAETLVPLSITKHPTADAAFGAGATLVAAARRRAGSARKADGWQADANRLNAEWMAERKRRNTADQEKAIAAQRAVEARQAEQAKQGAQRQVDAAKASADAALNARIATRPADYRTFLANFNQLPNSWVLDYNTLQGRDVTGYAWTTRQWGTFFSRETFNAVGTVAECADGSVALLTLTRSQRNGADTSTFQLSVLDVDGKRLGTHEIGQTQKDASGRPLVVSFAINSTPAQSRIDIRQARWDGDKQKALTLNRRDCSVR